MSLSRVSNLRALVAALALGCVHGAFAQTPVLDESEAAPTAPPALTDAQRQQVQAAMQKADGLFAAGKPDDAIALLESTDRKQQGDAGLAAALSSAFESKGDLEKALEWSRESYKRDATANSGSEWVHTRMLVAKIALQSDAGWFANNRVLDLDFGKGDVPTAPEILPIENGRIKGAQQLIDQVHHQIALRTKPDEKNPFAGDLHASIGDLMISGALTPLDGGKDDPVPEYEAALKLGAPNAALVQRRLAKYRTDFAALPPRAEDKIEVVESTVVSRRFEPAPEQSGSLSIYIGAATGITLVLVVIGWFIDRRRRKHAEANPPPPLPEFKGDLRKP